MAIPLKTIISEGRLGSGAAVGTARLFSLICAAVQLPLLTRLLVPSEYSIVAIAVAIATYFSLFAAEPVILSFQRYPGALEMRANYGFALRRSLIGLGAATAVVVGLCWAFGYLPWGLGIAGWGLGAAITRLVSTAWLMWGTAWRYSLNLIVSTGLRTGVLLVLVLLGWDVLLALAVSGIASALGALLFGPRRNPNGPRAQAPWPVSFGVKLAVASLAFTVLTNVAILILPIFSSAHEVGKFAAMSQITTLSLGALSGLVLTVEYPRLRLDWDRGGEEAVRSRTRALQLTFLAVALACASVATVADGFGLALVVSEKYSDVTLVVPLMIGAAFASMGQLSAWLHQFSHDAGWVARGTAASAVIGILAITGFTSLWGARGAAVGGAIGFFVYFLVMSHRTQVTALTKFLALGVLALSIGIGFDRSFAASFDGYILATSAVIAGTVSFRRWRIQ